MKKKRRKKKTYPKFSEKNTLRKLAYIIIIFIIISLLFEFCPDFFSLCKIFDNCVFAVFMQAHKDFFVNIVLGCLGSAVISYLVLYISVKTNENEKKEMLIKISQKVIVKYMRMISYMRGEEDIEDEKIIANLNAEIHMQINEYAEYYYQIDIEDPVFYELYIHLLCEILSVSRKIDIFLEELQKFYSENENRISKKHKKKMEVYKTFYHELDNEDAFDKDSFDAIQQRINEFATRMNWNLNSEIAHDSTRYHIEFLKDKSREIRHMNYAQMIRDVYAGVKW